MWEKSDVSSDISGFFFVKDSQMFKWHHDKLFPTCKSAAWLPGASRLLWHSVVSCHTWDNNSSHAVLWQRQPKEEVRRYLFFFFFPPHRDTKFPIQSVSMGTWSGLYHSANCSSSLQCTLSPSVIQTGICYQTKEGLGRVCMCVFVLALPPTCPTQTLIQTQINTHPLNQALSYQWVYI